MVHKRCAVAAKSIELGSPCRIFTVTSVWTILPGNDLHPAQEFHTEGNGAASITAASSQHAGACDISRSKLTTNTSM
jgi:hypothetical protein